MPQVHEILGSGDCRIDIRVDLLYKPVVNALDLQQVFFRDGGRLKGGLTLFYHVIELCLEIRHLFFQIGLKLRLVNAVTMIDGSLAVFDGLLFPYTLYLFSEEFKDRSPKTFTYSAWYWKASFFSSSLLFISSSYLA